MPRDLVLAGGIRLTFATPVLERRIRGADALNRGLARAIRARERAGGGVAVSNVGGWHSHADLFEWPEPEVAALRRALHACVASLLALRPGKARGGLALADEAWALVLRRGDSSRSHIHPNHHWSGVYYVDTGKPDARRPESGLLVFSDPRPGAAALAVRGLAFGAEHVIKPRAGLAVVFPSWLPHAVLPHHGKAPRVSIPFNVRLVRR